MENHITCVKLKMSNLPRQKEEKSTSLAMWSYNGIAMQLSSVITFILATGTSNIKLSVYDGSV